QPKAAPRPQSHTPMRISPGRSIVKTPAAGLDRRGLGAYTTGMRSTRLLGAVFGIFLAAAAVPLQAEDLSPQQQSAYEAAKFQINSLHYIRQDAASLPEGKR